MNARSPDSLPAGVASRVSAARAVHAVVARGRSLDAALDAFGAALDAGDRAFLRELCFGTLRWYLRLGAMIEHMTGKPLARLDARVAAAIAVGLYQLWRLRVPDHAAVHATVESVAVLGRPRLAGLANALLRRFGRERDAVIAATAAPEAVASAHPQWLAELLRGDWGDAAAAILAANNARAPLWLRVNRCRCDVATYRQLLAADPALPATATAAGVADAIRLAEPVPVTALPRFDDGWVSVQDAAAQLAADFVAARPGQRVLDACAAPGGKSAHLLERARGELDLTAVDSDAERLGRVRETLARLGFEAGVVHGDATCPADWWDGRPFDRILLDAPCSATGVIRRHPDIRHLRKPGDVPALARRQRALLDALWPLLAPGGRLVYATCSVLDAENAAVVNDFVSAQSNARAADELLNDNKLALMVPQRPGVQILPGSADFDGFYYACIVRQTDTP